MDKKEIVWLGGSFNDLRNFPEAAMKASGQQLMLLQFGGVPADWKPMSSVGSGVKEIRIKTGGEFRILYVANIAPAIFVLHAFQKKTRKTRKSDIDLAKARFKQLKAELRK